MELEPIGLEHKGDAPEFKAWIRSVTEAPQSEWQACGLGYWLLELAERLPIAPEALVLASIACVKRRMRQARAALAAAAEFQECGRQLLSALDRWTAGEMQAGMCVAALATLSDVQLRSPCHPLTGEIFFGLKSAVEIMQGFRAATRGAASIPDFEFFESTCEREPDGGPRPSNDNGIEQSYGAPSPRELARMRAAEGAVQADFADLIRAHISAAQISDAVARALHAKHGHANQVLAVTAGACTMIDEWDCGHLHARQWLLRHDSDTKRAWRRAPWGHWLLSWATAAGAGPLAVICPAYHCAMEANPLLGIDSDTARDALRPALDLAFGKPVNVDRLKRAARTLEKLEHAYSARLLAPHGEEKFLDGTRRTLHALQAARSVLEACRQERTAIAAPRVAWHVKEAFRLMGDYDSDLAGWRCAEIVRTQLAMPAVFGEPAE